MEDKKELHLRPEDRGEEGVLRGTLSYDPDEKKYYITDSRGKGLLSAELKYREKDLESLEDELEEVKEKGPLAGEVEGKPAISIACTNYEDGGKKREFKYRFWAEEIKIFREEEDYEHPAL
ncbi:MAG: hypothetical protein ACLFS3_01690 [Candidatus Aenigmatarchaeota archaeon]